MNRKPSLVSGILLILSGIILSYQYEVNSVTLFITAVGLGLSLLHFRPKLRGIVTAIIGMFMFFLGVTYEEASIVSRTIGISVGTALMIIGTQDQLDTFNSIINDRERRSSD